MLGWKRANGMFRFSWTESGGAAIPETSGKAGSGQTILRDIPRQMRGEIALDQGRDGLRYSLPLPIKRISNIATLASASEGG